RDQGPEQRRGEGLHFARVHRPRRSRHQRRLFPAAYCPARAGNPLHTPVPSENTSSGPYTKSKT
ncbi:unnamed protein product, partial [Ectocarpus sp. 8 AP-2014]